MCPVSICVQRLASHQCDVRAACWLLMMFCSVCSSIDSTTTIVTRSIMVVTIARRHLGQWKECGLKSRPIHDDWVRACCSTLVHDLRRFSAGRTLYIYNVTPYDLGDRDVHVMYGRRLVFAEPARSCRLRYGVDTIRRSFENECIFRKYFFGRILINIYTIGWENRERVETICIYFKWIVFIHEEMQTEFYVIS